MLMTCVLLPLGVRNDQLPVGHRRLPQRLAHPIAHALAGNGRRLCAAARERHPPLGGPQPVLLTHYHSTWRYGRAPDPAQLDLATKDAISGSYLSRVERGNATTHPTHAPHFCCFDHVSGLDHAISSVTPASPRACLSISCTPVSPHYSRFKLLQATSMLSC